MSPTGNILTYLSYSNYKQLVCKLPKLTLECTEMFMLSHILLN